MMQESMNFSPEGKYNYTCFPISQIYIYLYTYVCVCMCACVYSCERMKAEHWKKAKLRRECRLPVFLI